MGGFLLVRTWTSGGGGGIRTHEELSPLAVFKTAAFNHSATPPIFACYHIFVGSGMLSHMGKLMGIDYGTKRVGIALSNGEKTMAFPNRIIPNSPHVIDIVLELIAQEDIEGIVLGESVDLQGNDNPLMRDINALKQKLEDATSVPLYFQQEQFTSAQARRPFESHQKTRRIVTMPHVDASAAALILQSYLDMHYGAQNID